MTQSLSELALEPLSAALEGADAEKSLAKVFRRQALADSERAKLAKWVLGASCLRATLRFWLQDRDAGAAALIDAYRRFVEEGSPPDLPWPEDPIERLCVEASLPTWIARLWFDELGFESARSLALAMNVPGPVMLRANALHITREELAERLASEGIAVEPGLLAPHSLRVKGRANLWGSRAWREGLFEVQDEGSQLIVEACGALPGERWLDLCAGSGGKTLALAAAMQNRGELVAYDVDSQRLTNLRARLARARVGCVRIGEPADEKFDGVLVDAPCSELGTLRRHPDARWRITPESISHLPVLQTELLERARSHLRPGGRLVYATCTLRQAENEQIAGAGRTLRPDVEGTDGFFIATEK